MTSSTEMFPADADTTFVYDREVPVLTQKRGEQVDECAKRYGLQVLQGVNRAKDLPDDDGSIVAVIKSGCTFWLVRS